MLYIVFISDRISLKVDEAKEVFKTLRVAAGIFQHLEVGLSSAEVTSHYPCCNCESISCALPSSLRQTRESFRA